MYYKKWSKILPQCYLHNGYIDIVKTSFMQNNKEIHGDKMIFFESPVCTEVDSKEEFEFLQYQSDKNESILLKYLNSIKKE